MHDTDIFVRDSSTNERILVGTLYIKNDFTKEGQTYDIRFQVACGNEIELSVKHLSGQGYTRRGCISIAEIEVYNQPCENQMNLRIYWAKEENYILTEHIHDIHIHLFKTFRLSAGKLVLLNLFIIL